LVMGTTCDAAKLKEKSSYAGKGGNAFVIKLDRAVCNGFKGQVLKGFFTATDRDEASVTLASLPATLPAVGGNSCGDNLLAGLARNTCADDVTKCRVESKCVNCKNFQGKKETDNCYFVRMYNGGSKTLEQCLKEPARTARSVVNLIKRAVEVVQCIHGAGFYHRDFQLKNIMVEGCTDHSTLKVVDLDLMTDITTIPDTGYNGAGWGAFKDFQQLFGACPNLGYPKLEDMANSAAAKNIAKTLRGIAAAAMDCSDTEDHTDPEKGWLDRTDPNTGLAATILAGINALPRQS